ncbi:protein translocase subunit SecDF [Mycoplasma sp. 1573]
MNYENNKNPKNKLRWLITYVGVLLISIALIIAVSLGFKSSNSNANSTVKQANVVLKIDTSDNENLSENTSFSNQEVFGGIEKLLSYGNLNENYRLYDGNGVLKLETNINNDYDLNELVNKLANKSYIVVTDSTGTPLFYKNQYFKPGSNDNVSLDKLLEGNEADFALPLENNPANWNTKQASNRVSLLLSDKGNHQLDLLKQDYQNQRIYFWINLKKFVNLAENQFASDWAAANKNPVNFAYENNNAIGSYDQTTKKVKEPVLKNDSLNASKYLVSVSSPSVMTYAKPGDKIIYLFNNYQAYSNKELSAIINYAYSPYQLKVLATNYATKTFNYQAIKYVLIIVFAIIGFYLIFNYRILGLISSLAFGLNGLVIYLVLTSFGISLSPLLIVGLITTLLIAFGLMNNSLARFKREIVKKMTPSKAIQKSQKTTLFASFDTLLCLVVASIMALYLSINVVSVFASMVIVASIFTTIIIIGLNNIIIYNLTNVDHFAYYPWLLSLTKEFRFKSKIALNFVSKYNTIFFALVLPIAFIILFSHGTSFERSLDLSPLLQTTNNYAITTLDGITQSTALAVQKQLSALNIENVQIMQNSLDNNTYTMLVSSSQALDLATALNSTDLANNFILENWTWSTKGFLRQLGFSWIPLIVSLLLVGIYIWIRYSLITTLIYFIKEYNVFLLTIALMIIFKIKFDYNLALIFFIAHVFVIYSHLMSANKIKILTHQDTNLKNYIYSPEQIKTIVKKLINQSFRTSVWFLILVSIISLSLAFTTSEMQNVFLAILLINLSIFSFDFLLAPLLWQWMLINKFARKQKRIDTFYWSTSKVEEQEFSTINDFDK